MMKTLFNRPFYALIFILNIRVFFALFFVFHVRSWFWHCGIILRWIIVWNFMLLFIHKLPGLQKHEKFFGTCRIVSSTVTLSQNTWGGLYSSTLGPHLVGPRPPKYCKNKFISKVYYLFKIILIQDQNIILIQDIQKTI